MPETSNTGNSLLLDINHLHVHFPIHEGVLQRHRSTVKAVSGVSLELNRGEAKPLWDVQWSGLRPSQQEASVSMKKALSA